MASGDSHTGFDSSAFTVGAVTGAGVLAGALGAGFEAARQRSWDRFNRRALVAAVELTEARHNRVYKMLQDANRKVSDLRSEVVQLRAELKAERARQVLLARGR